MSSLYDGGDIDGKMSNFSDATSKSVTSFLLLFTIPVFESVLFEGGDILLRLVEYLLFDILTIALKLKLKLKILRNALFNEKT